MKRNGLLLSIAALTAMTACISSVKETVKDVSIAPYQGDRAAAVSLTYDDGTQCHYLEVAPELEKRGLRATFWIIGANIGTDVPDYPYMTWEQVAELSHRGHEVSNHSWTHPDLTKLPPEQVRVEIEKCDSAIMQATGKKPESFCYPYNAMSDTVVKLAEEGRVGSRTFCDAQGQEMSGCTDESLAQWLDNTVRNGAWAVTMTHSTDYGWDKWADKTVLWRLFDRLKERESEVWVAPFSEVSAYVKERDNTDIAVEMKDDVCIITPTMNLDPAIFRIPLTMKVEGDFSNSNPVVTQNGATLPVDHRKSCILFEFNPSAGPVELRLK